MQIGYGGMIFDLDPSGRSYQLLRAGQPPSSRAVQPALKLGEWYPFRLSVKAHVLTLEVAGRALEPHKLPAEHDPWLLLRRAGVGVALARNLELHGAPAVPERLALSASGDLSGWLASYYDEKRTGQQPAWEAKGDEIVGRRLDAESAAQAESVLQYHRPLLEDGLVRYEFFYEPSRTAVYPALDRLAFLLQPDGVGIHWLTDGVHDRSGLAADNATVEKENRRGPAVLPLKSGAWNKVEVALQGDTVTLRLNDVVVYERVLEPGNQRVFGLFRYADETAARVRKVEYHGGWRADFTADKGLWRLVR